MEFSPKQTVKVVAYMLLIAAITQSIYTGIYMANLAGVAQIEPPRALLWGGEGLLFTIMAAFAGSALVQAKRYSLGFSAIAMSAVLNVYQVGIGLTQFGTFREVAQAIPEAVPAATGVVALSFFGYNAAKILLALAAIVFGIACKNAGGKVMGPLTILVGVIAFVSNTLSMALGRGFSGDLPIAGSSGVLVTVLLAVCLLGLSGEDE